MCLLYKKPFTWARKMLILVLFLSELMLGENERIIQQTSEIFFIKMLTKHRLEHNVLNAVLIF